MRELLEGRRSGFAPRPALASVAAGLGVALFLVDLVSWSGWGVRDTNALFVGSAWIATAAAVVTLVALAAAVAERMDVPDEEASLARTDTIAAGAAAAVYLATAALRIVDGGASAASPVALLLGIVGLVLVLAGAALSSVLYASREWEELPEITHERHRRRAAGR